MFPPPDAHALKFLSLPAAEKARIDNECADLERAYRDAQERVNRLHRKMERAEMHRKAIWRAYTERHRRLIDEAKDAP